MTTNIVVDGITLTLAAQHLAIVIPSCPGLVYSLQLDPTATHIVAERAGRRRSLAAYPTVREAVEHFKGVVTLEETRRRADEQLERMQSTFEIAVATPLDDDADDGL